jgi:hypothetical protein
MAQEHESRVINRDHLSGKHGFGCIPRRHLCHHGCGPKHLVLGIRWLRPNKGAARLRYELVGHLKSPSARDLAHTLFDFID